MDDPRLHSVAVAFLQHHPQAEDEEARQAYHAAALPHAALFLAMLDAAKADQQAPAAPVDGSEPEPEPEPAADPKEES